MQRGPHTMSSSKHARVGVEEGGQEKEKRGGNVVKNCGGERARSGLPFRLPSFFFSVSFRETHSNSDLLCRRPYSCN